MNEVAELLNAMTRAGVIEDYAVFGAVAQMRYTQAVVTIDLDVLVGVPDSESLAVLSPIYEFCRERGYVPEGDAIRVGAWPVQFIPTFDALTLAAMRQAEEAELDGTPIRVVRADYLAVIALKVGRGKDKARILALLESEAVTTQEIAELASEHGLESAWDKFAKEFLDEEP